MLNTEPSYLAAVTHNMAESMVVTYCKVEKLGYRTVSRARKMAQQLRAQAAPAEDLWVPSTHTVAHNRL